MRSSFGELTSLRHPPRVAATLQSAPHSSVDSIDTRSAQPPSITRAPAGFVLPARAKVALYTATNIVCAGVMAGAACAGLIHTGNWARANPGRATAWAGALAAGWTGVCYAKEAVFGARSDGTLVPDHTVMRRMMPFIMPRRNDCWVRYTKDYDLKRTLPFIKTWNAQHDDAHKITLFHVMMGAFLWANQLHPGLNRFVKGNRLFARNEFSVAFAIKSEHKKYASLRTVKFRAIVGETFEAMVLRLNQAIHGERDTRGRNASEREMSFFLHLPGPVLAAAVKVQAFLDDHGLWPAALIDSDPLYSSVFAANLGSLHPTEMVDVAHHLYEYGTVTLFAAICSAKLAGDDPSVTINWTYDERAADAHYCLSPLIVGRQHVEQPDLLFNPITPQRLAEARAQDAQAGRQAAAAEASR